MLHLITGGSGFLGSNLTRSLHRLGERVRILDITKPLDCPGETEFVRCNILDRERVKRAMKGVDYVYHCAALVPLARAGSNFWKVNVEGTKIIVDVAYEENVKMFIYISSNAIFAGSLDRCPITSDTIPKPIEVYGYSKLAAEQCILVAQRRGLPCTIVRPSCILGGGRLGIFQILYDWIHEGRKVYVMGEGKKLFQFVHVNDVVKFIILCVQKHKTDIYNIGTDKYSTLRDTLTFLINYAGTKSRIVNLPMNLSLFTFRILDLLNLSFLAPFHYLTYCKPFYFDISKAINEIGWKPMYSNCYRC